ncbi:MAG: hypothetical protein ACR2P2_09180 [Nakamurella sp.]
MCVTCGCSADSDVRMTNPVSGETITLAESTQAQGHTAHQHVDASGRTFVHSHPAPEGPDSADLESRSSR